MKAIIINTAGNILLGAIYAVVWGGLCVAGVYAVMENLIG